LCKRGHGMSKYHMFIDDDVKMVAEANIVVTKKHS